MSEKEKPASVTVEKLPTVRPAKANGDVKATLKN